jgi:hypothetical protein
MNGHSYIESLEDLDAERMKIMWEGSEPKTVPLRITSVRPTHHFFSVPISGIHPEFATEYRRLVKMPKKFNHRTFKFFGK